jgi:hypothetical protein
MRIALEFASSHSATHRARLEFAFRLFCAIYGHTPLTAPEQNPDITLTYGFDCKSRPAVRLANSYGLRPTTEPAPSPKPFTRDGESTMLVLAVPRQSEPDWLGEIFEWVSCADEYSIKQRDGVGRVPFSASYIGRHHLDPGRPYAAVAMRFLQQAIARTCPVSETTDPFCPFESARHLVVNTHDIDFLPDGRRQSVQRLAKNAVISLLLNKSVGAALEQAKTAVAVAAGAPDPLDQISTLVAREENQKVSGTYYFLCDRRHRRDGNYHVDDPSTLALMNVLQRKMEVGVHGSYCSAEQPDRLAQEFDCLRRLGFRPLGSRQHWLRFSLPQLIASVERSGAAYDCSLGWPDTAGFRAGACFAFPPYDFAKEHAAPFLEMPLILMDQEMLQVPHCDALTKARHLLATSRHYGWGGISVLWHPTAFGGGQFPADVGELFWDLVTEGLKQNDAWMSAGLFVSRTWQRFSNAGLLPNRQFA